MSNPIFGSRRFIGAVVAAVTIAAGTLTHAETATAPASAPHVKMPIPELTPELMERVFKFQKYMVPHYKAAEAAGQPNLAAPELIDNVSEACVQAGFDNIFQCGRVFGYVGVLIGGCDPRTGTFKDPAALMRRRLEELAANSSMSQAIKDKEIADIRQVLAIMPDEFPKEHIELMNAYTKRINCVMR